MTRCKSPVLNGVAEFKKWFKSIGNPAIDAGEPDHYPCVAVLIAYTPRAKEDDWFQFIDYVYLDDFAVTQMQITNNSPSSSWD